MCGKISGAFVAKRLHWPQSDHASFAQIFYAGMGIAMLGRATRERSQM
jgi:hypothetical protein